MNSSILTINLPGHEPRPTRTTIRWLDATIWIRLASLALLALFVGTNVSGQPAPVLQVECPPDQTNWVCGVANSTVATYPLPVAFGGDCAFPPIVRCTPPSGAVFPVGTTVVTCLATNRCGERATCGFRLTVARDDQAPTLTCPSNVVVWTCGTNAVPVAYPEPVAVDNSGGDIRISCVPPSGQLFPIGASVVRCSATDECGNTSSCQFNVRVVTDAAPPIIECPADITRVTCSSTGLVVVYLAPEVADAADSMPDVECTPPSGAVFPVGATSVHCVATDHCGNRAGCTFRVTVVQDTTPPTIACPTNIVVTSCRAEGTIIPFPSPQTSDDWDTHVDIVCHPPYHPGNPNLFPIGVTTVTCVGTDNCGNRSSCFFTVTVKADAEWPGIDLDADGLRDLWEIHFDANGLAPEDDADGDGLTNAEESRAGTDPFRASSGIRLNVHSEETPAAGSFRLSYQLAELSVQQTHYFQLQYADGLGERVAWRNYGPPLRATNNPLVMDIPISGLPPSTISTQSFFRVQVVDIDDDGDGVTAWEEMLLRTSDLLPNTHDTPGGDHQAARDFAAKNQPGPSRLREVAAAHAGGSAQGPTPAKLVTAAGTGGFFRLSSWALGPGNAPDHLANTPPMEGYLLKLHTLTPEQSPNLSVNLVVSGRIREDNNVWFTPYRIEADGTLNDLDTVGYGANASVRVIDYAIAHRRLRDGANAGLFQLVTPVIGRTLANQLQLRVLSWTVHPDSGDLVARYDSGDLLHTDLQTDGGSVQIQHLDGSMFVVTYANKSSVLSQWFFTVNQDGVVAPRGGQASGLDFYGVADVEVPATRFALAPLNTKAFATAVLDESCALKIAVWEERVFTCDAGCYSRPFYLTDNTVDQQPEVNGVQLPLPVVTDSRDDTYKAGENFGFALATGDFNGDGYIDLAIGTIGENDGAGAVTVRYGAAAGFLDTGDEEIWTQESAGLQGAAETGDKFGYALAAGDFNGDGRTDLAIGAPEEDFEGDGILDAGVVHVLRGSASGLTANGSQLWMQDSDGLPGTRQNYDWFGRSLAAGDFNGDGRDDLVIGISRETVNGAIAGALQVIYGSAAGLSAAAGPGQQLRHQDSPFMLDAAEASDFFAETLATADFNGDGRDDLAVGIPREHVDGVADAGAVQIVYGSAAGLGPDNVFLSQAEFMPGGMDIPGVPEPFDQFGASLAAGDFNGDGRADLAVGVPEEDLDGNAIDNAGAVQVFYGSAAGLSAVSSQLFTQDSPGIVSAPEPYDSFGRGLAAGDFNGDGRADLAVGSFREGMSGNAIPEAGVVYVLAGGPGGLVASGASPWSQDSEGIKDQSESGDLFGFALAAGDFDGDGRVDLAVGIPDEDFQETDNDPATDAGAVAVFYAGNSGLTDTDNLLTQGIVRRVRALVTDKQWEQFFGDYAGKLFEQMPPNETTNVHAASVTKCMTLLLTAEALADPGSGINLNDLITISAAAAGTGGSFMGNEPGTENDRPLLENDVMPLNLLLWGMMIPSCNKSARAIAEHVGATYAGAGSPYEKFVDRMNAKASELQMVNTIYSHPAHGGVTTPHDLTLLLMHAWPHALFRQFAGPFTGYLCGKDANNVDKCYDFDKSSAYPGLEAWKGGNTGWTVAGYPVPFCTSCWLGQATRVDRSVIVALQQTGDRGGDSQRMFDYGFRRLFTPDYRGGHQMNAPLVVDFAVSPINDTLAFTAIVDTQNRLRLDTWQVVAGIGQIASSGSVTLTFDDLGAGTHVIPASLIEMEAVRSIESELDYLTGHLENGRLRLDVWRIAAEPGN